MHTWGHIWTCINSIHTLSKQLPQSPAGFKHAGHLHVLPVLWKICFFHLISHAQFATVVVQSLNNVRLFVTPWTAVFQASMSFAISWSLLKLMSIELVMPSNHLISVIPFSSSLQSSSASRSFPMNQFFTSGGQSIGVSMSDISPYNEYSELISFRIDWLDILQPKGL